MTDNLPATTEEGTVTFKTPSLLLDVQLFEHAQRVAKMFAESTMVPEHFRNNIGNCVIALDFAYFAGISPLMAMQRMYVIKGKPGIETQLAVALVNRTKRFTPIQYKLEGSGDNQSCVAYARERETDELCEGATVSIGMAKKEGWYQKSGSKWQTMPEYMLRLRSAMFFARQYAPDALMGMYSVEELRDFTDMKKVDDAYVVDNNENDKSFSEQLEKKKAKKKAAPKESKPLVKYNLSEDSEATTIDMKATDRDLYEQSKVQCGLADREPRNDEEVEKVRIVFEEIYNNQK